MKKLFTFIALGSAALVSADQYNQPFGNGQPGGGSYYQNQPNNGNYQQNQSSQTYQRSNQNGFQQQYPRNQSSDQYQRQSNQSYDQQRNLVAYENENIMTPDQVITTRIHDALSSGWFAKGFDSVSYDVNNGNVTLKGSIDTLENKNKVEDSVKKIDGVKQVTNQISVVKASPDAYSDYELQNSEKKYPQDFATSPQDRQLNARIREKVASGWFSKGYDTIVIRTANGIVAITGTVDKPEDVQKVSDDIKQIEGVKSVTNQLTVKNK